MRRQEKYNQRRRGQNTEKKWDKKVKYVSLDGEKTALVGVKSFPCFDPQITLRIRERKEERLRKEKISVLVSAALQKDIQL